MKTIELKNFWNVLMDRNTAKNIFKLAEKEKFNIIFDFKWITLISTSFADELFSKWLIMFWKTFKIINIEKDIIKDLIKIALITRNNFHNNYH